MFFCFVLSTVVLIPLPKNSVTQCGCIILTAQFSLYMFVQQSASPHKLANVCLRVACNIVSVWNSLWNFIILGKWWLMRIDELSDDEKDSQKIRWISN